MENWTCEDVIRLKNTSKDTNRILKKEERYGRVLSLSGEVLVDSQVKRSKISYLISVNILSREFLFKLISPKKLNSSELIEEIAYSADICEEDIDNINYAYEIA